MSADRVQAFIEAVDEAVVDSQFPTRDEALDEALRYLRWRGRRLAELRAAIDEARADAEANGTLSDDELGEILEAEFRKLERAES
jgi:Arc/MetJ-type ribon-helix-helix transcriptional regulator